MSDTPRDETIKQMQQRHADSVMTAWDAMKEYREAAYALERQVAALRGRIDAARDMVCMNEGNILNGAFLLELVAALGSEGHADLHGFTIPQTCVTGPIMLRWDNGELEPVENVLRDAKLWREGHADCGGSATTIAPECMKGGCRRERAPCGPDERCECLDPPPTNCGEMAPMRPHAKGEFERVEREAAEARAVHARGATPMKTADQISAAVVGRMCPVCKARNDNVGEVGEACWTRGCDGIIVPGAAPECNRERNV